MSETAMVAIEVLVITVTGVLFIFIIFKLQNILAFFRRFPRAWDALRGMDEPRPQYREPPRPQSRPAPPAELIPAPEPRNPVDWQTPTKKILGFVAVAAFAIGAIKWLFDSALKDAQIPAPRIIVNYNPNRLCSDPFDREYDLTNSDRAKIALPLHEGCWGGWVSLPKWWPEANMQLNDRADCVKR